jgi:hypothetical protein
MARRKNALQFLIRSVTLSCHFTSGSTLIGEYADALDLTRPSDRKSPGRGSVAGCDRRPTASKFSDQSGNEFVAADVAGGAGGARVSLEVKCGVSVRVVRGRIDPRADARAQVRQMALRIGQKRFAVDVA